MASRDKERFYWFKLDHEFFNGTKMNRLRKTEKVIDLDKLDGEGRKQICRLAMEAIYIKLLAEACTHNGELLYDSDTPYDDEALSEIMECPSEFLKATEERLISIRMLEKNEEGRIFLPELKNHIGECSGRTLRTHEKQRSVAESAAVVAESAENVAESATVTAKNDDDVAESAAPREKSALETETETDTETETKEIDHITHKIRSLPPNPPERKTASRRTEKYKAKQIREQDEFLDDVVLENETHKGYLRRVTKEKEEFLLFHVEQEHREEFRPYLERIISVSGWKGTDGKYVRNTNVYCDVQYQRWKREKGYRENGRTRNAGSDGASEEAYRIRKEAEHDRLDAQMMRGEVYD